MLLRNYIESLQCALEKLRDYGYAEAVELKEEIRARKQAVIRAKIVLVGLDFVVRVPRYTESKMSRNLVLIWRARSW